MKNFGGAWLGSLLVAVVLGATGLVVVGSSVPAMAAGRPIPCAETIRPGQTPPPRPSGQGIDVVASVSLTVGIDRDINDFNQSRLYLRTGSGAEPYPGVQFASVGPNATSGDYVFSTEGGADPNGADTPGTYSASVLRDSFSPYFAVRDIEVIEEGPGFRPLSRWTARLTFRNCDSDGDSVDELNDVCPSVDNPDQADLDRDRVGDACDPDADGDSAVDTSDNCPMLANDQTDSDGDRVGNACDSTPFPPAPVSPPPGSTGTTTTGPAPVAATPILSARTITLTYARKKRVFKGAVRSDVGTCTSNADVSLWRKKKGADRRVVVRTTNELGKFRTSRVGKRGTYYATVAIIDSVCAGVTSRTVRVRRR